MAKVVKRTFSLTEEQAAFIDAKVGAGGYVSGSEVVREGLRGLQSREASLERWLVEEVVPTYDRVVAGTEPMFSSDEVRAGVRERLEVFSKAAE
jgi:antitoxin ParD1/3/4